MKKVILYFAMFTAALMIISCEKDETNQGGSQQTIGKATITGMVEVNLDMTNDTAGILYEAVPAGTKLYAKINSKDLVLVPNNGVTYADMYYETTVAADGTYTFSVDANTKDVTVDITADDFIYQQVQADTTNERTIFSLAGAPSTVVYKGKYTVLDLMFN